MDWLQSSLCGVLGDGLEAVGWEHFFDRGIFDAAVRMRQPSRCPCPCVGAHDLSTVGWAFQCAKCCCTTVQRPLTPGSETPVTRDPGLLPVVRIHRARRNAGRHAPLQVTSPCRRTHAQPLHLWRTAHAPHRTVHAPRALGNPSFRTDVTPLIAPLRTKTKHYFSPELDIVAHASVICLWV